MLRNSSKKKCYEIRYNRGEFWGSIIRHEETSILWVEKMQKKREGRWSKREKREIGLENERGK